MVGDMGRSKAAYSAGLLMQARRAGTGLAHALDPHVQPPTALLWKGREQGSPMVADLVGSRPSKIFHGPRRDQLEPPPSRTPALDAITAVAAR